MFWLGQDFRTQQLEPMLKQREEDIALLDWDMLTGGQS